MNLKNKIIIGTIALVGLCGIYKRIDILNLGKKDFKKASWGLYNNSDERLWDNYTGEKLKIYRGSGNWARYQDYVSYANKGNIKGQIWLPDLDGNNLIGKIKPTKWISGKELFKKIKEQEK